MTNINSPHNQNPWLSIPASDYESHMSSNNVRQTSVLNHIFETALNDIRPKRIAVLGCGTGNGFEHIRQETVEKIFGIDINPEYLEILKKRYGSELPALELSCSDLNSLDLPSDCFDLIYAALIFEYVDCEDVLKRINNSLKANGALVTVIQLPSSISGMVSETPYTSLKSLESIMHLVNPQVLNQFAMKCGLKQSKYLEIPLKLGKKFLVFYHVKQ